MAPRQDLVPVASIREQIFRVDCASFAAYVVLYYDYLLTLGDEIHLIWSAKQLTLNALVFYANRYIVLFGHIPLILGRYLLSEQSPKCQNLLKYHQYLAGAIQVVAGVALVCRVYALYGRRRWAVYPLAILGLVVIGFGLWALHGMAPPSLSPYEQHNLTGCILPLRQQDASHYAGAWIGMLVFDLTVFLMTVYKSIARWKKDEFHQDVPLLHILLRDGTIYFGVMVLLTVSVIISLYKMPEYDKAITAALTNVLSSVMISRLMLNLRAPFISASRNFDSKSYTSITGSTFSINDSGNLSNGEVLLQQVDWTPNQSTVLVGHAKGRNPSDATSTTAAIQVLHGHGTAEEERLMGNINEYPRKIIHRL